MSGIFKLGKVGIRQEKGTWSTASDVWLLASPVIVRESPFGYFAGGYPALSSIRRIDYSSDTTILQRSSLTHNREQISGVASLSYGYFGAGKHPGTNSTTVERIDFANDTLISVEKGPLATSTGNAAATGTKDYGYFGGGVEPGTPITTVQRIDYVNDTATAVEKGPLTQGRALLGATGNSNHGYWMGGWGTPSPSPARRSTVDRIDYSSDTTATVAKGSLTATKYGVGSTGNANFGYCGGGNPGPYSTVERVDYSNDTATALAKGPLAAAMRYMSVTGNSSHGYWCEGHPGPISTINRIDYDNDTASISRGNGPNLHYAAGLSAAANALASNFIATASNTGYIRDLPAGPAYGYWLGGYVPGNDKSTVDRLDFNSDTSTAAPKGPLTTAKRRHGACGNNNYGYIAGGEPSCATLVDGIRQAGSYEVRLDAADLSSGVYFYRLQGGNQQLTRKMTLSK